MSENYENLNLKIQPDSFCVDVNDKWCNNDSVKFLIFDDEQ